MQTTNSEHPLKAMAGNYAGAQRFKGLSAAGRFTSIGLEGGREQLQDSQPAALSLHSP